MKAKVTVTDYFRVMIVVCPLAIIFIAVPGWLAKTAFQRFALSPNVLSLWLDAGTPGFILAFALPTLLFQIMGNVVGFCVGVFIVSRLAGKERMIRWLFTGKQIPGLSKFAMRIVDLACRARA